MSSPDALTDARIIGQFLEAVPVGVFVIRPDGTPYYANQRAIGLMGKGISPDPEVDRDNLAEVYQAYVLDTGEAYPQERMPIVQALFGNHAHVEDMGIRHPERDIPLQVWASPVHNEDGQLEFAIAAFEDITARKKAEAEIAAAHAAMRMLLDNVDQGFLSVDREGTIVGSRSAAVDRWFGAPEDNDTLGAFISRIDADVGVWIGLGWEQLSDGFMPHDIVLSQLPRRLRTAEAIYQIAYQPVLDGEDLKQVLVVITDITAELERERAEASRRQLMHIFDRILQDRRGFVEFFKEAEVLLESLGERDDFRPVHTLKGNCGLFGMTSMVELCHTIEGRLAEEGGAVTASEKQALQKCWHHLGQQIGRLLGEESDDLQVRQGDYRRLENAIIHKESADTLLGILSSWKREPTAERLDRIGRQARALADRLGRGEIKIEIADNNVRLDPERWAPFWAAFVHVVRNAVDHGLSERGSQFADQPHGTLRFITQVVDDEIQISVQDNGPGINWDKVAARGKNRGLPHHSRQDQVELLFADGVSTKEAATEVSGRGVGLAAVRDACRALGGQVEVSSEPGAGTTFWFRFPAQTAASRAA